MDNNKKSSLINMIALIELIAVIAVMSLGLIKGYLTGAQANILVGTGLLIFWVLSDLVEPYTCGKVQDLTLGMRTAYVKYIALDLIGYAGILYFLAGVGGNGHSSGLLGAVVYVVTMKPKRDNMLIYLGKAPVDEDDEEEEAVVEEELPTAQTDGLLEGEAVSDGTEE